MAKKYMHALYTVKRCRKNCGDFSDDKVYGVSHGAMDDEVTLCGLKLSERWYITNNTFDGKIECTKCKTILKSNVPYWQKRIDVSKKKHD